MALRIEASVELAHLRGDSTLVAFLDCSKCYKRIEHRMAGERVRVSGMQTQVPQIGGRVGGDVDDDGRCQDRL